MPLESAQYVGQLDQNNPVGSDPIANVDEHIRMIKRVLKDTFPGLTGPVNLSAALIGQLQAASVPQGIIAMWSGAENAVPAGWGLCNGTNGTPDLRGRFVVGAAAATPLNSSGGSTVSTAAGGHNHTATASLAGGHDHGGAAGNTTLTLAQIPSHKHTSYWGEAGVSYPNGTAATNQIGAKGGWDTDNTWPFTSSEGGGQAHNHTISAVTDHTHTVTLVAQGDHTHSVVPPYYALAFIMKL